ncbi:MAG: hypothetical protein ACRDPX_09805 [Gaiellaceae bacterium]
MRDPAPAPPKRWLTPAELVTIGIERSRVVMMNEDAPERWFGPETSDAFVIATDNRMS